MAHSFDLEMPFIHFNDINVNNVNPSVNCPRTDY